MPSKQQNRFFLPPARFVFVSHFACFLGDRKVPRTSIVQILVDSILSKTEAACIYSPSSVDAAGITVADVHYA